MDNEIKKRHLKQLAKSSEGEALFQYLNEKIASLVDARNYNKESFEMDGKASVKAADILRELERDLNILKKDKPEQGKNQYL